MKLTVGLVLIHYLIRLHSGVKNNRCIIYIWAIDIRQCHQIGLNEQALTEFLQIGLLFHLNFLDDHSTNKIFLCIVDCAIAAG